MPAACACWQVGHGALAAGGGGEPHLDRVYQAALDELTNKELLESPWVWERDMRLHVALHIAGREQQAQANPAPQRWVSLGEPHCV